MKINTIDAKMAKEWFDNGEAVIIDVREPGEYAEVHIPGAILEPVGTIELAKLPPHGSKKLVIHCKFGKRGGIACEKLLAAKADLDVYNLEGGITAWMDAGLPVQK